MGVEEFTRRYRALGEIRPGEDTDYVRRGTDLAYLLEVGHVIARDLRALNDPRDKERERRKHPALYDLILEAWPAIPRPARKRTT